MAITLLLAGSCAGLAACYMLILLRGARASCMSFSAQSAAQTSRRQSKALPFAELLLGAALALRGNGPFYLGRGALHERWQDTQGQWRAGGLLEEATTASSSIAETPWQLAMEHPVFRLGPRQFRRKIFQLVRPRPLEANRQYEHSYIDAHSDWLQSLFAEVGFVRARSSSDCAAFSRSCGACATRASSPVPLPGLPARRLRPDSSVRRGGISVWQPRRCDHVVFWVCFFSAVQHCRLQSRHS